MSGPSDLAIWTVTLGLGLATYLIRFSFVGLMGGRRAPGWAERLLRYVPSAMLPALAATLLFAPSSGEPPDALQLGAAALVLAVGLASRNLLAAMLSGLVVYFGAQMLGF